MLPPSVPRFWLAMLPVQEAACASKGNSCATTGLFLQVGIRASRADEHLLLRCVSMRRNSGSPQRLTSLRAARLPRAVLNHQFGAAGNRQSTLPGSFAEQVEHRG